MAEVDRRERRVSSRTGVRYLLDAWTVEPPGDRFVPTDSESPSVFHPPEARGAVQHAIGYPYCPTIVEKGDGDLDRPT